MPQSTSNIAIATARNVLVEELVDILSSEGNVQITSIVANGKQLLETLHSQPIDITIIDIDILHSSGMEAIARLKKEQPGTRILVITEHNTPESVATLLRHGAEGYIAMNTLYRDLSGIVRKMAHS